MSNAINMHLMNAQEHIKSGMHIINPDITANKTKSNLDTLSAYEPCTLPELEFSSTPDTYPKNSWALSKERSIEIKKLLGVSGESEVILTQLNNGNYQLSVEAGLNGKIEIPDSFDKYGSAGGGVGIASKIVFNLTPDELAILAKEPSFMVPEHAPIPSDKDFCSEMSGLEVIRFENIDSVTLSGNASGDVTLALDKMGIDIPSSDIMEGIIGKEVPEELRAYGEVSGSVEIRRGENGSAEIVSRFRGEGKLEIIGSGKTPGGVLGATGDFLTPLDADKIINGAKGGSKEIEFVHNLNTDTFYTQTTTEVTRYQGTGTQRGVDFPVADELLNVPDYTIKEESTGSFTTETNVIIRDNEGGTMRNITTESTGTYTTDSLDLNFYESNITKTEETYGPPKAYNPILNRGDSVFA